MLTVVDTIPVADGHITRWNRQLDQTEKMARESRLLNRIHVVYYLVGINWWIEEVQISR